MRRTSLVLAVVAAMATVLVFAAPAFAVAGEPGAPVLPDESDPAGPGGTNPQTGEDNDPPENAGGEALGNIGAGDTIGGLASHTAVADATLDVRGVPPGHHILVDVEHTPGECVQDPSICPPTPPQD